MLIFRVLPAFELFYGLKQYLAYKSRNSNQKIGFEFNGLYIVNKSTSKINRKYSFLDLVLTLYLNQTDFVLVVVSFK